MVAGVIFLLISGAFIAALSKAKGRLTFGDSGKLNYAWYVNGTTYRHWQGEPTGSGLPKHPTRKIFDTPAIYEFGSPVGGTYPLWYDPSYWYEGVQPEFDLRSQVRRFVTSAKVYYAIFFDINVLQHVRKNSLPMLYSPLLIIALLALFSLSRRGWLVASDVSAYWFMLIPALITLIMYSLIYLEPRHIAPFAVLLFAGAFASVRLPDSQKNRRSVACGTIIILATFMILISPSISQAASSTIRGLIKGEEPQMGWEIDTYWQVADGLKRMGVQPGDKVACLKHSNRGHAPWARLARVQIVAEIYTSAFISDSSKFWTADPSIKNRIIETFATTGATMIVDDEVPSWASAEGWQRIGETHYYVYFLPDNSSH